MPTFGQVGPKGRQATRRAVTLPLFFWSLETVFFLVQGRYLVVSGPHQNLLAISAIRDLSTIAEGIAGPCGPQPLLVISWASQSHEPRRWALSLTHHTPPYARTHTYTHVIRATRLACEARNHDVWS